MRNRNLLNIDVSYPTFSIQTLLYLRYHVHGIEWDGKLFFFRFFSLYLMLIWMIWICVMIGSRQDIYLICFIQQFHFTRFDCRVRKKKWIWYENDDDDDDEKSGFQFMKFHIPICFFSYDFCNIQVMTFCKTEQKQKIIKKISPPHLNYFFAFVKTIIMNKKERNHIKEKFYAF